MAVNQKKIRQVLQFWSYLELFVMPDLPPSPRSKKSFYSKLRNGDRLPWEKSEMQLADPNKEWKHTLYLCCVKKQDLVDTINLQAGFSSNPAAHEEPITGETCLASLVINQFGQPMERTYLRTSIAYVLDLIQQNLGLEEIPEIQKETLKEFKIRFQVPVLQSENNDEEDEETEEHSEDDLMKDEYEDDEEFEEENEYEEEEKEDEDEDEETELLPPVGWEELNLEMEDLKKLIPDTPCLDYPIICVSQQVNHTKVDEAAFLNSFYLNDLARIEKSIPDIGIPLKQYLEGAKEMYDMQLHQNIFYFLQPQFMSPGRWPSNIQHGLYCAQQNALNLVQKQLKGQSSLLGINGPPGTGKTTLLREVIADVVVTRASRLLNININDLFRNQRNKIHDYASFYEFDWELIGNSGILIASNNNAAVENISKELPLLKSIDIDSFPDAEYFSIFAESLVQDECWGLLSAALGNSENRNHFNFQFWSGNEGFKAHLQSEIDNSSLHFNNFLQTKRKLTELLNTFKLFQNDVKDYHQLIGEILHSGKNNKRLKQLDKLTIQLNKNYGLTSASLPGPDFLKMSVNEIHASSFYSSEYLNKLRSEIFIVSLDLHRHVILNKAKQFSANLSAFMDMIGGNNSSSYTPEITQTLWNSLFFCIPVVSTTLASAERLLAKMGKGSIGWLLLDEAGQATPQSAAGVIWRSERSIIIGDTMQIPPVVTISEVLSTRLLEITQLKENWSPHKTSAQSLADNCTPFGTFIKWDGKDIWTGIPLRAHRRCAEPMFSISNSIAYNNQMVKVTREEQEDFATGNSRWIHVKSNKFIHTHVVLEEVNQLKYMIQQLVKSKYAGQIYVISPFKVIASYCEDIFNSNKQVSCGTIHRFQGKEAEIVFLILGTAPGFLASRKWAAQTPNILNVAVTRAKKRLYVIADENLWKPLPFFSELSKMLKNNNPSS